MQHYYSWRISLDASQLKCIMFSTAGLAFTTHLIRFHFVMHFARIMCYSVFSHSLLLFTLLSYTITYWPLTLKNAQKRDTNKKMRKRNVFCINTVSNSTQSIQSVSQSINQSIFICRNKQLQHSRPCDRGSGWLLPIPWVYTRPRPSPSSLSWTAWKHSEASWYAVVFC